MGLGSLALASLMDEHSMASPYAPRRPHFAPKAKNIIYLFMAGGPSHLDLFDWKPELKKRHGQDIPPSFLEGKRFAFMNSSFRNRSKLQGTIREFKQHGQSGLWVSECFPHIASIADEITLVKSCRTNLFNHAPAKLFMNTGTGLFGRPSMGSWVTYGLGTESRDLPGFIVLQSGPRGPRGGGVNWASGFLPTSHQGVPLRGNGDPILNLASPSGIDSGRQRASLDALRDLNLKRAVETGDEEINTRIASYEMAYRMQSSAPELIDFSKESKATLDLYGAQPGRASFANNCLLARRLVERGTRFVQLYHTNWDHHGGPSETLTKHLDQVTREVDKPAMALLKDLQARGLLDDTLVIWGGEFGRTPMGENRNPPGRNHHIDAFSMWFAGGGVKRGAVVGETDEFGFNSIRDECHVHDLHATILHLLGLDHEKLTFRFQGRDFRLTDVEGRIIRQMLA
tara:strand:+ start:158 stop:1525 length:1368 start_codon:yes stop_codon:yes gene_type:complete